MGCQQEYDAGQFIYLCPDCGQNLDLIFDYKSVAKNTLPRSISESGIPSIWRYEPLLPVHPPKPGCDIQVGWTPLMDITHRYSQFAGQKLLIKDDTRNPSGSLKDRASEAALSHMKMMGSKKIVAASTGNAAASLSCLAAWYNQDAVILAPASAPPAKLTQIQQYGAALIAVDGTYDDAFELSWQLSQEYGWYNRNTGINPVLSEGKKTAAFEIAEQLNWQAPDKVLVPVGDGCIVGGVYKGFYELLKLGWIDQIPAIIGIQADGSSAITDAYNSDASIARISAKTIADSISVGLPRDGLKALRAIRESNGKFITVSDDEILSAQLTMSCTTGIFAEPAAAAAYAGFEKLAVENEISETDVVVLLVTGNGLKDISAAQQKLPDLHVVSADLNSLQNYLNDKRLIGPAVK